MIIFAEREVSIEDFCVTACSDPVVAQGFKLSIEEFKLKISLVSLARYREMRRDTERHSEA